MAFRAPTADIAFAMEKIGGFDPAVFGDIGRDTVAAILAEAGRFAADMLLPLDKIGDREGVTLRDGVVATAPGWKEAYRAWVAGGWGSLSAPEEYGGQGLPVAVQIAVEEIWNAANAAFAVCPMLTIGAAKMLAAHAAPELASRFVPRLVSGEWTATMNLTEPQAGSDLGAIRTIAERQPDGTYRLSGQKIFITYGEHDLTPNIVHLVLARLPDAPAGTAGISLFVVPKFLVEADDSLGARNGVMCVGVERKLGLHGAPTCTMAYDGATGFLVGEEDRGLAAMFTMMNLARLSVGIQAVGVAERACQEALAYARERRQGRNPAWHGDGMSPIVLHPDVAAMLLRMKALTAAARALCYACGNAIDRSQRGPVDERQPWNDRASLLTPVAKAFATDSGIEVASLGIQVHGGAGYIEETGAAQRLRDVRVFAIYEGTNGIQAIDLVTRKLKLAGGQAVLDLLDELAAIAGAAAASNRLDFGRMGAKLTAAVDDLRLATAHLASRLGEGRIGEALGAASSYLRLFALAAGGALLAKGALAANVDESGSVIIARCFAETIAGESSNLRELVIEGAGVLQAGATILQEAAGSV